VTRARAVRASVRAQADAEVRELLPVQVKRVTDYANMKAEFDSNTSLYNIAVEQHGPESAEANKYRAEMDKIGQRMDALQRENEERQAKIDEVQYKKYSATSPGADSPVEISPKDAEDQLSAAEDKHKKLTDEFDRFQKLAEQKKWGIADTLRGLPILEGFASPTKIQQYTLDELPIDYSFKFVTRYDRCTTCHLGLEKSAYEADVLRKLMDNPAANLDVQADLTRAVLALTDRQRAKDGQPPLSPE